MSLNKQSIALKEMQDWGKQEEKMHCIFIEPWATETYPSACFPSKCKHSDLEKIPLKREKSEAGGGGAGGGISQTQEENVIEK